MKHDTDSKAINRILGMKGTATLGTEYQKTNIQEFRNKCLEN